MSIRTTTAIDAHVACVDEQCRNDNDSPNIGHPSERSECTAAENQIQQHSVARGSYCKSKAFLETFVSSASFCSTFSSVQSRQGSQVEHKGHERHRRFRHPIMFTTS